MLSGSEFMMSVVHEAEVRQATAYGEHRFAVRLAARARAQEQRKAESTVGWKVWKRLGSTRGGRKAG
jgi:hypothetical protein